MGCDGSISALGYYSELRVKVNDGERFRKAFE